MFVEIGLLCKGLPALRVLACKRSLARVGPKMVEKVVPLPKRQVAVVQVAFHQAIPAVGARVLVLN